MTASLDYSSDRWCSRRKNRMLKFLWFIVKHNSTLGGSPTLYCEISQITPVNFFWKEALLKDFWYDVSVANSLESQQASTNYTLRVLSAKSRDIGTGR